MPYPASLKRCARPNCDRAYENHRWGAVAAHAAGWFLQRNGDAWCPDHTPEWVAEWRARKQEGSAWN